ncbi:hypothetical protein KR044_009695, partial [Drosophila immigrans]
LGGFDVSFDVDVDLVKLPAKPPQPSTDADPKSKPLRESTNNSRPANGTVVPDPPASPTPSAGENAKPMQFSGHSPRRSLRRSGGVPGSDRLRRVAIQRRSRSCGRRDLLQEFNDVVPRTSNSVSPNTTPAITTQPNKQVSTSTAATETEEQLGVSFKYAQPHAATSQRSFAATSQRATNSLNGTVQRTYTVELGPEPGQLLLSPSRKSNNSRLQLSHPQQSPVRHSPARAEILVPDTPPRVLSQAQREPEFTVPESQPPDVDIQQQVLHTLTSSPKAVPFVVVPISCLSPKAKKPIEDHAKPAAAPSTAASPKVASRSMQTSGNSRYVQNLDEILTDDDSDINEQRESSSVPLNLAPTGGNTTRQSRLKKRQECVKSPNQLLDLHRTRLNTSHRRQPTRQTVLNKISKAPINGEKFAQELARMSNYEILDLRKRNSLGKLHPMNGRRQQRQQQQNIEECIEWELMRRNLDNVNDSSKKSLPKVALPTASPIKKSLPTASSPPMKNSSLRRLRSRIQKNVSSNDSLDSSMENSRQPHAKQRRRRREPSLSEDELLAVCTPPAQFRHSKHRQAEEPSTTLLAEPPAEFRRSKSLLNSSAQLQRSKRWNQQQAADVAAKDAVQLRKSKSMQESNKTVLAEPPPDFRSTTRHRIEDVESDEPAALELPTELHKSKAQHLETNKTVLADPPEQFRKTRSRNAELPNSSSLQESRRYKSRQRIDEDDESDENEVPLLQLRKSKSRLLEQVETNKTALLEPPEQFRKSRSRIATAALQESRNYKSGQRIEDDDSDEVPLEAPAQFRKSKSRLLDQLEDVETNQTVMPDPPEQFRKGRKAKNKDEAPPPADDEVFKKPLAPAPRAKQNRKLSSAEKELENLRIMLPHRTEITTWKDTVDDPNTTGVRKSRRGHVPLRNTWVHTQSDPFFFMRKANPLDHLVPRKPKNQSRVNNSEFMDRPPLSSSTPRNEVPNDNAAKRKRNPQTEEISGIAALSIAEQAEVPMEPVGKQPQKQPTEVKSKRGRKKKAKIIVPPLDAISEDLGNEGGHEPNIESSSESPTGSEMRFESAPECPPTLQSINPSQNELFPLSWLRQITDKPIPKNNSEPEYESMNISRASQLQYSEIKGLDYAFYSQTDNSLGYMRFKPSQVRRVHKSRFRLVGF